MQPTFYDQNGCAINMMGHRTGTPMRLVSPAPVLVPGAAPPRPQAPTIYQPAQGTPQTMYSQQNNSSNIGGKRFFSSLKYQVDTIKRMNTEVLHIAIPIISPISIVFHSLCSR